MVYRADKLRAAKGVLRKTDGEIAADANLNRATVGRVLDGDPHVGVSTLRAVAVALGFTDLAPLFEVPEKEKAIA
jgi:hypothetical protein